MQQANPFSIAPPVQVQAVFVQTRISKRFCIDEASASSCAQLANDRVGLSDSCGTQAERRENAAPYQRHGRNGGVKSPQIILQVAVFKDVVRPDRQVDTSRALQSVRRNDVGKVKRRLTAKGEIQSAHRRAQHEAITKQDRTSNWHKVTRAVANESRAHSMNDRRPHVLSVRALEMTLILP